MNKWLIGLLCTVIAISLNVLPVEHRDEYVRHIDFDAHYYGALVERSGSYADVDAVRSRMMEATAEPQPEGVVGTATLIALVFMPLSTLDLAVAEVIWTIIAVVAMCAGLLYATPRKWWCYTPLAFATFPIVLSLYLGNVSALTFALTALAYGATKREKHGLAGSAVGVAAAFKLFPAFLVLAFVLKRKWTAVWWSAGVFTALSFAGLVVLGPTDFVNGMERTFTFSPFDIRYQDNVSIPGIANYEVGKPAFSFTIVAAAFALGLYAIHRNMPRRTEHVLAATSLLMLLCLTLSWNHYFGIAVVGLLAVLDSAGDRRVRIAAVVIAALGFLPIPFSPALTITATALLALLLQSARSRDPLLDPLPRNSDRVIQR
jgi:uncharacterized membrane protein